MDKISAGLFTIIGIIWLLPLLGITSIGFIRTGAWIQTIAILLVGINGLTKVFKA